MVKPRFETMDKIGLVIAALMVVGAFAGYLFRTISSSHTHRCAGKVSLSLITPVFEHITPSTARLYGLCSLLVGAALAVYVLWATSSDDSTPTI